MQNTEYSTIISKNTKIKDNKTAIDGIQISRLDKNVFVQRKKNKKQKNRKKKGNKPDRDQIRMNDLNQIDDVFKKIDKFDNWENQELEFEDPVEFKIVKEWFLSRLGLEMNSIRPLGAKHRFYQLSLQELRVEDYAVDQLEKKEQLLLTQLSTDQEEIKLMVIKCPALFCLSLSELTRRLRTLLKKLKVKTRRVQTFPHLLLLSEEDAQYRIGELAKFFSIKTDVVVKGLRQAPQILFYHEDRIQGLIAWLWTNGFEISTMGKRIILEAPGTLNYDPRRLQLYQTFLTLWGVGHSEILDIFEHSIGSASSNFLRPENLAKFVFLEQYVGYSVSLVLTFCPRFLTWSLEERIAPRYFYSKKQNIPRSGWLSKLWQTNDRYFLKYFKGDEKDYNEFYERWRLYEWPYIQRELFIYVHRFYLRHWNELEVVYPALFENLEGLQKKQKRKS